MLDTDVVIAALDRRDTHHRRAATVISSMLDGHVDLLISTVNYAEALVKPAENERTLRAAVDAIAALGIRPLAPNAAMARNAARYRALRISLAGGFALATAHAHPARVATFDRQVRRAMGELGLKAPPELSRKS